MRAKHTAHTLEAFPIYSCAFVAPQDVVLGGGGGQSRSGIKNKLVSTCIVRNVVSGSNSTFRQRLYHVESDKVINLLDELELEKGEDAPMSMAAHLGDSRLVCGINSSEEYLLHGENQNCRLFGIKENKFVTS